MKKVLHRSFKPAKCKMTLQMATSRLKILKNKKDTQIKQLRRELAHLLESGQTQTAKIRVEHVVREKKTVAAYELVGIYCELIVARLGVIESQKTCPNDLKEPVASVLYASKRLSDVGELADVVKHFSAKYGKDFVSAAIGLQPDSGVSRLLVDKLSVKAPDGPTKIKILKEIATEHNVTWEAESMAEPDPKETVLLSGASSSQSVSGNYSDSSRIPNNQPPDFQAPATANVAQNSYATDGRSSSRTASADFNIGVGGLEEPRIHFLHLKSCHWTVSNAPLSLAIVAPNLLELRLKCNKPKSLLLEAPKLVKFHLSVEDAEGVRFSELRDLDTLEVISPDMYRLIRNTRFGSKIRKLAVDSVKSVEHSERLKLGLGTLLKAFPGIVSLSLSHVTWSNFKTHFQSEGLVHMKGTDTLKQITARVQTLDHTDVYQTASFIRSILSKCRGLTDMRLMIHQDTDPRVRNLLISACTMSNTRVRWSWGMWAEGGEDIWVSSGT